MCIFHRWVAVEDADHLVCGECFAPPSRISEELKEKNPEYRTKGYCPHSFKVCSKCGKAVGYGSHGKLTVVPDSCKKQIKRMGGK
jgi:hypothetical protein